MTSNWIVVGISGVTCGGKTTLATRLHELYPGCSVLINQDDYYLPEDSDKHVYIEEVNHANWDIISSLDMGRLHEDIAKMTSKPVVKIHLLIIDGFLIFNYRKIEQLCDKKYYVCLTKEQCWDRRRVRTYIPLDPPGYFEKCVWPMHEMYKKEVDQLQDIVFFDGTTSTDSMLEKLKGDLAELMASLTR